MIRISAKFESNVFAELLFVSLSRIDSNRDRFRLRWSWLMIDEWWEAERKYSSSIDCLDKRLCQNVTMTWNSRSFCSWRIVRRVEIVEDWTRNMWIQKASKDDQNFVNNSIFTKFLSSSSKNTDIRISLDREFNRLWEDWSNYRISRIECRTTRREIRNDDNNYDLFDFFVKFFDFTMSDLKKTMKFVLFRNECWWHEVVDRSQLERIVKDFQILIQWESRRKLISRLTKSIDVARAEREQKDFCK